MAKASKTLRAGGVAALLFTSALTAPALAQELPRFSQVDGNGVDLITGRFTWSMTEGSIGSGEGALSLVRNWAGESGVWTDNWSGILYTRSIGGVPHIVVEFGTYSDTFTVSGSTYTSTKVDGATLTGITGGYRYTASDGTRIDYLSSSYTGYAIKGRACDRAGLAACSIPTAIRRPNGMTYALAWDIHDYCSEYDIELNCIGTSGTYVRFRGVSNSAKYGFGVDYVTESAGSSEPADSWYVRSQVQFTNLDSAPGTLPTVSYAYPSSAVTEVTDTGGETWRLTLTGANGQLIGIRRPGSSSDDISVTRTDGLVTQIVADGVTTGYSRSLGPTVITLIDGDGGTTDPQTIVTPDAGTGTRIGSVTDPLNHTTTYAYDGNGRLERVTMPEGNSVGYTYDARGNITETRLREKDDSSDTGDDIVTSASYDSSCSNVVTCNRPNSVTDAHGHVTEFSYDPTHGGVTVVTAPAPSGSGDQPQTRYAYDTYEAVDGQPVYLPTGVSTCSSGTAATCIGTANEARTVTAYDTYNLRVTSVTARNGSNTISSTGAFTYDQIGNLLTVDGPLSGSADTTRFRYDDGRRVIGTIGPDPDGGGSRVHAAVKRTYINGLLTKVETGTVQSQSDTHWAAFSASQRIETDYDTHARPIQQRLMSGSTIYGLSQASYDPLGRAQCAVQRMNPAEFGSLTSDACALDTQGSGSGDYGPDRITRTYYDAAGRVSQVRAAFAVSGQEANVATYGYTNNGRVLTLTDANGNTTANQYDVHDRLVTTFFPNATGGGINWGDYIAYGYDDDLLIAASNRAGSTQSFAYDNLDRLTSRDLPGSEPTVNYSYDLLGRMLTASTSSPSHSVGTSYDALGRVLTQVGPQGTASFSYDEAGRRTTLSYPGSGPVIGYSYNAASQLIAISRDPAGTPVQLAAYAYDDHGRRTLLTRGNGATTAYDYDDVSRLSQMVHDADDTTYDLTLDYGYNPASQIVSTVRSNDVYAWGRHYAVTRSYTANGRNEYSAVGGNTPAYDGNRNMTSSGASGTPTYTYTSENMLTSATGGVTLAYDPALRLYETVGGTTTRMAYDGQNVIAEYNSSNAVQRRYVFGPGGEPLVAFEGSGTSTPTYYHADERGSVIALSDGDGAVTGVNAYDEYGIPAAGNAGRFQYTGQQWLPELDMYHYRARIYSPSHGRFLQTDPIGYAGGMNLRAYVGNDPVNLVDPTGLDPGYCLDKQDDGSCSDVGVGGGGCEDESIWWDADPRHKGMCLTARFLNGPPTRSDEKGMGNGSGNSFSNASTGARLGGQLCVGQRFSKFFAEQSGPATAVANAHNADPTLLLGLSGLESGWGTSPMYEDSNNPFGATPGGDATPGVGYRSFSHAWQRWDQEWGARINNVESNAGLFINRLLQDNRNRPGAVDRRGAYNSLVRPHGDPRWPTSLRGTIDSVRARFSRWQAFGC